MEPALNWFINNILPWVFMGSISVFIYNYNQINRLDLIFKNHIERESAVAQANRDRITSLESQMRKDLAELRSDVEYLNRNNITRAEMERYLTQVNGVVERISNNLDKLL